MMTVLLESAAARGPRRNRWATISITVHVVLIASAIVLTTRQPATADGFDEPVIPLVPYVPPRHPEPQPAPARPVLTGLSGAPSIPSIPIPLPTVPTFDVTRPFTKTISPGDIFHRRDTITTAGPMATGGVHTWADVQRVASPLPGNGSPDYPRVLRTAGVDGSVVVTFVVDTVGRAEPGSIAIVSATHPLFAQAVRHWLARTRYAPAEINGQRVRQLVQQEVGFTLK